MPPEKPLPPTPLPSTTLPPSPPPLTPLLPTPLLPAPRRPSSVYTVQPSEVEPSYDNSTYGVIVDQYFGNELLQPKTYRASASKLPDQKPLRPTLLRDTQFHAASDPIIERRRVEQSQHKHLQGTTYEKRIDRSTQNAKQHAEDYESVLHTRSSVLPCIVPDQLYSDTGHLPSKMSPRITDVVDQSLVPSPLRFSSYEEPGSRFSSDSSSDAGSCQSGLRDSVKSYARKTFSKRSFTQESIDKDKRNSASPPKPKGRLDSMASHRRASLQHGIEEMYDTLTNFSLSPAKPKTPAMQLETNNEVRIPRERVRSPAIPLTQYQMIGVKAFEDTESPKSSKTSFLPSLSSRGSRRKPGTSTRDPNFSSPESPSSKRPVVKKWAAAFQSKTTQVESAMGLETNRVKRSKSEKKRAELKKKITVIGLGDDDSQPPGSVNWM
ncbi:MAG: hypothetical protein Q9195_001100 [Heterodermia aff. obscurata]